MHVMMVISIPLSITTVNRWTKFSEKEKKYISRLIKTSPNCKERPVIA